MFKMHSEMLEKSNVYIDNEQMSTDLYNVLRENLNDEQKSLLDKMEEEFWNLLGLYENHYLCGFKDGIELNKLFIQISKFLRG